MSMLGLVLVGFGSGVGAVARCIIRQAVSKVNNSDFPWETWLTNVFGTLLLGLCFYAFSVINNDPNWFLLLATGFCGGFTTFSTMSVEVMQLFRRRLVLGIVYLGSSLALGFVLAWMTRWLA